MQFTQRLFTTLTETLPVSSLTFLMSVMAIPRMDHCCVEAGIQRDPAGDGILTLGPGTWRLSHSQRTDRITSPGHPQMAP